MKKGIILIFILVLAFTGCKYYSNQNQEKSENQVNLDKGKTIEKNNQTEDVPKNENKEYFIGTKSQSKVIKEWASLYRDYDGVYVQKIGDYRGVLINLGYAPNPGYKVKIDRIIKEEDKWSIEVSLKEPDPGKVYNEVISYPYNILSIIDDSKPIEVIKVEGTKKKALPTIIIPEGKKLATSNNFIVVSPLMDEKITSPVIIKGKARVFEANFRIHIEDGHNYLAEKILMADEGAPAYGNFSIRLPFNKPTNPNGFVVLSYANMANGKMIEELTIPVRF